MNAYDILKTGEKVPFNAVEAIKSVCDLYRETLNTCTDIAKINAARDVALENINRYYDTYNRAFEKRFNERDKAMDEVFRVIEKGISENNEGLIGKGLESLSGIVSSSPFIDIQEFQTILDSGEGFEL